MVFLHIGYDTDKQALYSYSMLFKYKISNLHFLMRTGSTSFKIVTRLFVLVSITSRLKSSKSLTHGRKIRLGNLIKENIRDHHLRMELQNKMQKT